MCSSCALASFLRISWKSKMEFPAEGEGWRKKYVSANLVYSYRVTLGGYREIGDARAYNDRLDDRARHHRIDHRRQRYPHVYAPDKPTISSRRPHFTQTARERRAKALLLGCYQEMSDVRKCEAN